ncbi:MAG TPA: carboxypeptidase regulatory-like domain-containing protein [Terriglobia bacterium]|nr:carboxypeptidase regulatory-like domain-containing protein [Terriglobia bacterium]
MVTVPLGLGLCLLWATMGWAQLTATGTINGNVIDATGSVVPGATVTLTNEATGSHTSTTSNADGSYIFPGLEVANYGITVAKQGFETSNVTGIALHPSVVTTINITLKVGQTVTEVTVSATLAAVQTQTSEVSNQVAGVAVETLPLNGRNYQSLSALMPGVTNLAPGVSEGPGGFLTSNTMSINGMGASGTLYSLDGLWNMNTGNMTQTTITPNPDTIQEVRVLQNNYSVQYGLLQSSVVLLATKSGTDHFHGSAFEYLRNTSLDARNFFSPTVPVLHQNIFGYTIGGPVYIPGHINSAKKRTFFFWSQQWTDQHIGNVVLGADPTAAERLGDFSSLCPAGFTAGGLCSSTASPNIQLVNPYSKNAPYLNNNIAASLSTNSLALLSALAPLPNDAANGFNNYINVTPTINTTRDDQIKIDHNFSDRVRMMAEYLDDRQTNNSATETFLGDPYSTNRQPITTGNQLAQIQLTATLTPSMVNTTSIGMNNYVVSLAVTGIVERAQVSGFSETLPYNGFRSDRLPTINFSQGWAPLGTAYQLPLNHASDLEDTLSDDWSWLHGKHYIQAGANLVLGTKRQDSFDQSNGLWGFSGNFTGSAMADYLIGQSTSFSQSSTWPRPYDHYPIFSPYVQDRIKVTRRLTLTAGFRWEFIPRPHAQTGYDSIFIPSDFNPANAPIVSPTGLITATPNFDPLNGLVRNGLGGTPANFFNNHQYFVAPSLGFAYDVFGDGKTSIRGGYGVTYQRTFTNGDCSYSCADNPPLDTTLALNNAPFPSPFGGAPAAATILAISSADKDFKPAQIQSYSLSLEHQFKGDFIASISAAGTIQRDLPESVNDNQALPDAPYDFSPAINGGNAFSTLPGEAAYAPSYFGPYPGWSNISNTKAEASGFWDALEVNVRHPAGHNIMLTASYTWQHGLDSTNVQDVYHPGAYYGPTGAYVPQVLTFSWIWSIPYLQGAKGIEGAALGGWKFSGVGTIQSGFLSTPGNSEANTGLAGLPDVVAGQKTTGPKTVAEWFNTAAYYQPPPGYFGDAGTGSIHGPGTVNFDMAFHKDFRFKEHYSFEFRAELFNIFNHANFNGISTGLGSGNFGQIVSASDPRIAEFALRFRF